MGEAYLQKGAIVPEYSRHNEQLTYILEGKLREGEVLRLPSSVPHKTEALEETLDVDIFNPPRRDWLDHTDDYFKDLSPPTTGQG